VVVVVTRLAATERDLAVIRWVGEQYAVPMRVLAGLAIRDGRAHAAGSADRLAPRAAWRLKRLGYAARRPLLGQTWLVPSRCDLRFAGLDYSW
jgi:hypothetical protein